MRDTIRSICYLLCLCLMGFGIADTAGHFMPDRPAVLPWAFSVMMIFLGFGFLRLVPKPKPQSQSQPQRYRDFAIANKLNPEDELNQEVLGETNDR